MSRGHKILALLKKPESDTVSNLDFIVEDNGFLTLTNGNICEDTTLTNGDHHNENHLGPRYYQQQSYHQTLQENDEPGNSVKDKINDSNQYFESDLPGIQTSQKNREFRDLDENKNSDAESYSSNTLPSQQNAGLDARSDLDQNFEPGPEDDISCISSTAENNNIEVFENNNIQVEHGNMNENRKRHHKGDKNNWKKNLNKRLRMEGKQYLGYTAPKGQVMKQNKIRHERKLKPTCTSRKCQQSKVRMCAKFSEEARISIFQRFWSELNWDQRRMYVIAHVTRISTKRKTTNNEDSRRMETLKYTLSIDGCKYYPVCRQMFLNTLALGSYTVHSWTKNSVHGMHPHKEKQNSRTQRTLRHSGDMKILAEFLGQLPKLPSHYNRQNSAKLYLEPIVRSLKQLYDLYKEYCVKASKSPLSNKTFYTQFHASNLSLYQPKKDQCDQCVSHGVGNLSEEDYAAHIRKKDRARTEKANDKSLAERRECVVLSMDLQAVKVAPFIQANKIYFKTKLACHNFTIYDLTSHHCTCYWFTECDTNLVASSFISCLLDYLTKHCLPKRLPVIIYSDGCTYQNRNNILANALLNFSIKNKINIVQKYLERGHTQMECDSVHSCIERKLKNRDIHLPSDYLSATKEARTKPGPYDVVKLEYDFFQDFSNIKHLRFPNIRPGRKVNDPTVTDIRAINYDMTGTIQVKLDFDEGWQNLPTRPKIIPNPIQNYPQLNKAPIPISRCKWNHLQELKEVLPKDCHSFYDSIPHA